MKKIILVIVIFLLVGCASKKLEPNYEKMQIGKGGINGYTLDLRVYGNNKNNILNEIIKVENYNNKEYMITRINNNKQLQKLFSLLKKETTKVEAKDDITYIINDKVYVANAEGKYELSKEAIKYSDPSIYLEGLKNISKISKTYEEKIGLNTYKVYDVIFQKDVITDIAKDTDIKKPNISNKTEGKIYINDKGYVYRIIYVIDGITVNANYFGINTARSLVLPDELKTK